MIGFFSHIISQMSRVPWSRDFQAALKIFIQVSTGISGLCPIYTETVWNDRRYKDIEKYFDPLVVQLLRNRTGEYLRDGHWLNKAVDSIKSRVGGLGVVSRNGRF